MNLRGNSWKNTLGTSGGVLKRVPDGFLRGVAKEITGEINRKIIEATFFRNP